MLQTAVCDLVIQASAEDPDIGLLVVNILNKDVSDPNPSVRTTAITTICSLPILLPHVQTAVNLGLHDSNTGVRVSAVTGVGKVWRHSPDACREFGLVERLYGMLRDPEPTVVTFSLQTLNIILANEGGVKVTKKMIRYLLSKVITYREKEFCFVVTFLYLPEADEELTLEILNNLDSFLDHHDGNVMLSVAGLFVKLITNNTSLKTSLVKRIVPVLIGYLKSGSQRDFNHNILEFIQNMEDEYVEAMKPHFKVFFTKTKDTEKVKLKKVKFLPRLVTEDSAMESINFLFNLLPQNTSLNQTIFESITKICVSEKSCYVHGIVNLEMLLKTDCDTYINDILLVVKQLNLDQNVQTDSDRITQFVRKVLTSINIKTLSREHVSPTLHLLEHFCQDVPESPYLVESLLEMEKTSWSPALHCHLLSASYQVFLSQPAAMQIIMGRSSIYQIHLVGLRTTVSINFYAKLRLLSFIGLVLQDSLKKKDHIVNETCMFYLNLLGSLK